MNHVGDQSRKLDRLAHELQQELLEQARLRFSETVIDHWMHPRGHGSIENPDGRAGYTGPCGDTMEIQLRVRGDVIVDARFLTDGCATTIASASMAVELATGRSIREAATISKQMILEGLEGLPRESEHCAFLAETALKAAIADYLRAEGQRVGEQPEHVVG